MKAINSEILDYIRSQRVSVFTIEMMDGSPHAATVHFAHTGETIFIFETHKSYRKTEALQGRDISRASLVIGFNDDDRKTLQMDGVARIIDRDEDLLFDAYIQKFPEKRGKLDGPDVVLFTFRPTWWRFTDWTRPEGKLIILSTDES